MLKEKTICRLAKKRGWIIDIRRDSNGDVRSTFIHPPRSSFEHVGHIRLEGSHKSKHQIVWLDARMRDGGNVHINAYYSYPRTIKDCEKMLAQVEELIEKYC